MRLPERDIHRICKNRDCNKEFSVANRFDTSCFCNQTCGQHQRYLNKKDTMRVDNQLTT